MASWRAMHGGGDKSVAGWHDGDDREEFYLEERPKWEFRLWDDADNNEFVKTQYPQYYQLYLDLPRPINRVDMVRYLYLHFAPGFYIDSDCKCLRPLDPLLNLPGCSIILGEHLSLAGRFVECAFMASSEPGHPFWIRVIEAIKSALYKPTLTQRLAQNIPSLAVLVTTGPLLLSQVLQQYLAEHKTDSGIHVFPPHMFYPPPNVLPYPKESFSVHMFSGSWVGDSWEYRIFELQQTRLGRIFIAILCSFVLLLILAFLAWSLRATIRLVLPNSAKSLPPSPVPQ